MRWPWQKEAPERDPLSEAVAEAKEEHDLLILAFEERINRRNAKRQEAH